MGDHRGLLSRAEGCWTFDARDRMPRSSRLPVHAIIVVAGNATDHDAVTLPRERVRSSTLFGHWLATPNDVCGCGRWLSLMPESGECRIKLSPAVRPSVATWRLPFRRAPA